MDQKSYTEKLDIGCKIFYVDFCIDNKYYEIQQYTIHKKLCHAIGNGFAWEGIGEFNKTLRLSYAYCFMTENEAKKYVSNVIQQDILVTSMHILESEKHRNTLYEELIKLGQTPEQITANVHKLFERD